ncbi:SDR family oxidoreductase [Nocardia arthritidis]|uniref:SDR family oxidoreductase n=1 Tax=Nocardia arthritidis TaxID=228602 RepID=A0A6G9YUM9_9NOCA|nr:SDR family oxidoreductase [Nocardia arthritidis]
MRPAPAGRRLPAARRIARGRTASGPVTFARLRRRRSARGWRKPIDGGHRADIQRQKCDRHRRRARNRRGLSESTAAAQPLARFGEPDEVAAMVRFLITEATFSTGSEFVLDGGATAGRTLPLPS